MNELNSIKRIGTYKKDELVRREMRTLLQANPRGIGSEDFVNRIRAKTAVSRGKIFSMMKKFQQLGLMKIERGEDRRRVMYLPNLQKIKSDQLLSDGLEFVSKLLSEPNIRFGEGEAKSRGPRVRVSIFSNQKELTSEGLTMQAKEVANQFSSGYDKLLTRNLKMGPSAKAAFIITLEI